MMKTKIIRHSCVGRNPSKWSTLTLQILAYAGMTILGLVLFVSTTFSQNLTNAEYFFDVDPGVGNGTALSFTLGQTSFDITPSLTQGLVAGTHVLSVRAKDENGNWGFAERRSFFILAASTTDPPIADITAMEYFIDDDPGFGGATTIVISSSNLVDLANEIINASALSSGFHSVYIRAKNANNVWSFTERRSFFIPPGTTTDPAIATISAMEYYIDTDPGVGGATSIPGATGSVVDFPIITINANTLPAGFHTLGIRTKNTDDVWGFDERRQFYIISGTSTDPPIADMVEMEYFFDVDPGFGLATDLSITSGSVLDISPLIPESLSGGYHHFFIRSKNADDTWGLTESRVVYVKPTVATGSISDITKMEYFFDGDDPGVGLATDFPVVQTALVDLDPALMPTPPTLIDGQHEITVRAQNADGVWGVAESTTFDVLDDCTQPVASFTPQLNCAGQAVTFVDTSTDIQPDAVYNWDFNGDGTYDDFTVGNTTFTYSDPGTYAVELKITQGTICLNTYTANITIQPQPIAVFSTMGTTVNEPTNFTVSAINLPPAVTWSWDFEDDAVVDDNTVGNNSFTYTAEATYNPTLSISDGLGCEVVVTNPITITSGGNTPTASVDFLAENGCVNNNINFSDLSQNLPGSASYSWDFDGDGTEDATTIGAETYTYSAPGSYDAKLIIDLGGSTIEAIHTIEIVDIPVVDFSTLGTEVNFPTDFMPTTSNLEPTAVWEWDFDANLVIDDNTTGNTSYTYTTTGTYNPNLKISNGYGCETTKSNSIVIIDSNNNGSVPTANFLTENGCVNGTTTFIDLSQNIPAGATYSWDFDGDGTQDASSAGNQSISFATAGSFTTKLIIDIDGSLLAHTQLVEIVEEPIANFSTVDVCVGSQMDFTDISTSVDASSTYSWDFDNDGTEDFNAKTGANFTFATNGTHLVKLIVSNGFGCSHEIVKQVQVVGLPVPDFNWDVVCTGEVISFNDLSYGTETNAMYSWDFDGDGTEDFNTDGDKSFTFAAKGIYDASLTISNLTGCETTITKSIEIIDRPEVAIDIIAKCYGQESQMVDLSQKISPTATYSWDFDNDGTQDDNTIGSTTFSYPSYNSYIVNLTVDNGGGCSSSTEKLVVFSDAATPDFSINKTCQGEEVVFTDISTDLEVGAKYSWDFDGDGTEDAATPGSTVNIFNTTGVFNTTLTIDNGGQCLAFKTMALDVTPPPAVNLGEDLKLCIEGDVTFDAGIGYSAYLWPDGSSNQTFTVSEVGNYMVKVQDAKGCFNTDTIAVKILGAPAPAFDHYIELSLEGIKVHFTNTTTNGDNYSWSFGDGATSDEADPTHTYSDFSFYETSVYEVCITATNSCEEAQFCENIFVSPTDFIQEAGSEVKLYPNPVNRILTLEVDQDKIDTNKVGIYNGQGQQLWTTDLKESRYDIDMENFASGTYFLMLEQIEKLLYKRIIKQ